MKNRPPALKLIMTNSPLSLAVPDSKSMSYEHKGRFTINLISSRIETSRYFNVRIQDFSRLINENVTKENSPHRTLFIRSPMMEGAPFEFLRTKKNQYLLRIKKDLTHVVINNPHTQIEVKSIVRKINGRDITMIVSKDESTIFITNKLDNDKIQALYSMEMDEKEKLQFQSVNFADKFIFSTTDIPLYLHPTQQGKILFNSSLDLTAFDRLLKTYPNLRRELGIRYLEIRSVNQRVADTFNLEFKKLENEIFESNLSFYFQSDLKRFSKLSEEGEISSDELDNLIFFRKKFEEVSLRIAEVNASEANYFANNNSEPNFIHENLIVAHLKSIFTNYALSGYNCFCFRNNDQALALRMVHILENLDQWRPLVDKIPDWLKSFGVKSYDDISDSTPKLLLAPKILQNMRNFFILKGEINPSERTFFGGFSPILTQFRSAMNSAIQPPTPLPSFSP